MGDPNPELVETLSSLLKRIEEGRHSLRAQRAVFENFESTVVRRERAFQAWRELVHIPLPEEEHARRKAEAEAACRQSEYERLRKEADGLWLKQGEVTAFIGPFVHDVAVVSDRLPPNRAWNFYRQALKKLLVGYPGAWADPPTSADLETLEMRLREMIDLAAESLPVKTVPDVRQRRHRTPDLETSRERIALLDRFRAELTTVALEQRSGTTTLQMLKQKYPQFQLWRDLPIPEQESLLKEEFRPRAYASNLVLRHYGLTSEETLKKDRKKLRDAEQQARQPLSE